MALSLLLCIIIWALKLVLRSLFLVPAMASGAGTWRQIAGLAPGCACLLAAALAACLPPVVATASVLSTDATGSGHMRFSYCPDMPLLTIALLLHPMPRLLGPRSWTTTLATCASWTWCLGSTRCTASWTSSSSAARYRRPAKRCGTGAGGRAGRGTAGAQAGAGVGWWCQGRALLVVDCQGLAAAAALSRHFTSRETCLSYNLHCRSSWSG